MPDAVHRDGTDAEEPENGEFLCHAYMDRHGVAAHVDSPLVPGAGEVVGDSLPRRIRLDDHNTSLAEGVLVDGLRAGAGGGLGFVIRGAPGGQHVATVDDEPGDREECDGEDDNERGHGAVFSAASARHGCVPR